MVDIEPLPDVEPRRGEASVKIIRAPDAALMFDGEARLAQAKRKAAAVIEAAKIRYENESMRGYEEGKRAGDEAAAELLNDTVIKCEQYIASREADLVDLVLTTTQSLLEDFDDRELASRMLKKALLERRAMRGMSLYVHPSSQEAFTEALDTIRNDIGHIEEMISVSADVSLDPGMCVLDTPLGYVQLGIEAQLEALRNGLMAAFLANPMPEGPLENADAEDGEDADA